jgi:hypothetical protein
MWVSEPCNAAAESYNVTNMNWAWMWSRTAVWFWTFKPLPGIQVYLAKQRTSISFGGCKSIGERWFGPTDMTGAVVVCHAGVLWVLPDAWGRWVAGVATVCAQDLPGGCTRGGAAGW